MQPTPALACRYLQEPPSTRRLILSGLPSTTLPPLLGLPLTLGTVTQRPCLRHRPAFRDPSSGPCVLELALLRL